jgi:hypothetical protein
MLDRPAHVGRNQIEQLFGGGREAADVKRSIDHDHRQLHAGAAWLPSVSAADDDASAMLAPRSLWVANQD